MIRETMTPEERLEATLGLKPVDRVCCAPMIGQYAGQYAGITNREFVWDWEKCMASVDRLHADFPVWDCNGSLIELRYGPATKLAGGCRIKLPGEDLPDNAEYQMHETEIMTQGDYAIIENEGFAEYQNVFLERSHGVSREQVEEGKKLMHEKSLSAIERTRKRGQSVLWGPSYGNLPFDAFSMMRSIESFYMDMHKLKDKLLDYLQAANDHLIRSAVAAADRSGIRRVFVGGMRGSGQFIALRHFDRFVWPFFKQMIEAFAAQNIVTVLHLDSDWTKNLEYFLELPPKSFVMQLDSATDIFKAKEILRGHCCLMGDVPAALLTVASPSEVDEYCRKLIDEVGRDGGYFYSVGCATPFNARHENMRVFFDAVEKYGVYC
jgi:Uroporphyrinogen-III decarboxylase